MRGHTVSTQRSQDLHPEHQSSFSFQCTTYSRCQVLKKVPIIYLSYWYKPNMSWLKIELINDTWIFFFSFNDRLTAMVTVLFTFRHSDCPIPPVLSVVTPGMSTKLMVQHTFQCHFPSTEWKLRTGTIFCKSSTTSKLMLRLIPSRCRAMRHSLTAVQQAGTVPSYNSFSCTLWWGHL